MPGERWAGRRPSSGNRNRGCERSIRGYSPVGTLPWTPVVRSADDPRNRARPRGPTCEAALIGGEFSEFAHQVWPADPGHLARMRSEVRGWLAPLALPED